MWDVAGDTLGSHCVFALKWPAIKYDLPLLWIFKQFFFLFLLLIREF